jgi:hypothetical protein
MVPRKLLVEVTMSVHQNEHLARRLLHERGGSFGVKGISRDKKTGQIVSKPHVHTPHERITDLADQILERLKSKSNKTTRRGRGWSSIAFRTAISSKNPTGTTRLSE